MKAQRNDLHVVLIRKYRADIASGGVTKVFNCSIGAIPCYCAGRTITGELIQYTVILN